MLTNTIVTSTNGDPKEFIEMIHLCVESLLIEDIMNSPEGSSKITCAITLEPTTEDIVTHSERPIPTMEMLEKLIKGIQRAS